MQWLRADADTETGSLTGAMVLAWEQTAMGGGVATADFRDSTREDREVRSGLMELWLEEASLRSASSGAATQPTSCC
jgi:hypothetical protein